MEVLLCAQLRDGPIPGIGLMLMSVKPGLVSLDASAEVRYGCSSHRCIAHYTVSENQGYER